MGWNEKKEGPVDTEGKSIISISSGLDSASFSQDLSAGALNYTSVVNNKFAITSILLHCSAQLPDTNIKVYLDSKNGASYDTLLADVDFENTQDVALLAGNNLASIDFEEGDEVKIISSGTDVTGLLTGIIKYRLLT